MRRTRSSSSRTRRAPTSPTSPSSTGRSPGQFAGAKWVEPLDELSAEAAARRSREHRRGLQVGRQDLRGLLLERLPHLDLQQEAVRQGGHHDVPDARSTELGAGRRQAQGGGRPVPALDPDGGDRGRRHAVVPAHARERRQALRQQLQADVPEARLGRLQGAAVGGARRQEGLGLAGRGLARRRRPPSTSSPRARPRSCSRPAPATS